MPMQIDRTSGEPVWTGALAGICVLLTALPGLLGGRAIGADSPPQANVSGGGFKGREVPAPLPDHPGNVFLESENVRVPWPKDLPPNFTQWRLLDDRHRVIRRVAMSDKTSDRRERLQIGSLGVGWYRLEFGSTNQPDQAWTTLAVLGRLRAPVPVDSPVAVDVAAAWFARDDALQQKNWPALPRWPG
jgi:hypothetical protein